MSYRRARNDLHAIRQTFSPHSNRNASMTGLDSEGGFGTHGRRNRTPAGTREPGTPRGPADLAQDDAARQPRGRPRGPGAEHRAAGDAARPLTYLRITR